MKYVVLILFFLMPGTALFGQDIPASVKKVLGKYACISCHSMEYRMVGPSWKTLAKQKYTAKQLGHLLRKPEPNNWPDYPPMEPVPNITNAEVKILADWLNTIKN